MIVGGGIVGTSVAYHLAKLGWTDVVLLEQGSLSGGTTWHAAGLVGQLRSSSNLTQLIRYSADLYRRLEAETGQATGWKRCGSISVARTRERMVQLQRNAALARSYGIEAEVISAKQAGSATRSCGPTIWWARCGSRETARPIRPISPRPWPGARGRRERGSTKASR
mgnify:CR=1 FL=1